MVRLSRAVHRPEAQALSLGGGGGEDLGEVRRILLVEGFRGMGIGIVDVFVFVIGIGIGIAVVVFDVGTGIGMDFVEGKEGNVGGIVGEGMFDGGDGEGSEVVEFCRGGDIERRVGGIGSLGGEKDSVDVFDGEELSEERVKRCGDCLENESGVFFGGL